MNFRQILKKIQHKCTIEIHEKREQIYFSSLNKGEFIEDKKNLKARQKPCFILGVPDKPSLS